MRTRPGMIQILLLLLAFGPGVLHGERWHLPGWRYRKTVTIKPESLKTPMKAALEGALSADFSLIVSNEKPEKDIDAALLKLVTDGNSKPDGSDIRILDAMRREVPYEILFVEPQLYIKLLFRVNSPQGKFLLYYGNPKAPAPKYNWRAKRGLFLETRPCPAGMPRSLKDMLDLVKRAPSSYGLQYTMWIFNHYNPLGPVDRYLYIYRGWLRCPETGRYILATTSDGPSFFLVDGKLAVQKLSLGPASINIKDRKGILLTKGMHEVVYYAGGKSGPFRAVAAWKTPSGRKVDVIRFNAFPKVLTAQTVSVEKRGAPFALDFDASVIESIPLGDSQANSYRFTNKSKAISRRSRKLSFLWDFGDGTTSTEESPTHVFFQVGDYKMTLTARDPAGREEKITRLVRIEDYNTLDHERQHVIDAMQTGALHLEHHHSKAYLEIPPSQVERVAKKFLKIVEDYPLDTAEPFVLHGLFKLYTRMKVIDKQIEVGEMYLKRFAGQRPEVMAEICATLSDVYLNDQARPREAKRVLEHLMTIENRLSPEIRKVAYLRLGELYLTDGDLEKAKAAYEKAANLRTRRVYWQAKQLKIGAYEISVVAALNEKKYAAARETLDDWEKEFPRDIIRGRSMLLRGKSYFLERNFTRAVKEFQRAITANPSAPWTPETYYLLAKTEVELKDYKGAVQALGKMLKEFPKSHFAPDARKLLKKVKRKVK